MTILQVNQTSIFRIWLKNVEKNLSVVVEISWLTIALWLKQLVGEFGSQFLRPKHFSKKYMLLIPLSFFI